MLFTSRIQWQYWKDSHFAWINMKIKWNTAVKWEPSPTYKGLLLVPKALIFHAVEAMCSPCQCQASWLPYLTRTNFFVNLLIFAVLLAPRVTALHSPLLLDVVRDTEIHWSVDCQKITSRQPFFPDWTQSLLLFGKITSKFTNVKITFEKVKNSWNNFAGNGEVALSDNHSDKSECDIS